MSWWENAWRKGIVGKEVFGPVPKKEEKELGGSQAMVLLNLASLRDAVSAALADAIQLEGMLMVGC